MMKGKRKNHRELIKEEKGQKRQKSLNLNFSPRKNNSFFEICFMKKKLDKANVVNEKKVKRSNQKNPDN